jgi:hypothetical protein
MGVKQLLKKNKVIFEMHQKWQKYKFEKVSQMSEKDPEKVSKIRYKEVFGTELDLDNPNFN